MTLDFATFRHNILKSRVGISTLARRSTLARTMAPVSENSPTRAGSYCQRLSYVKFRPVREIQSSGFFVCKRLTK